MLRAALRGTKWTNPRGCWDRGGLGAVAVRVHFELIPTVWARSRHSRARTHAQLFEVRVSRPGFESSICGERMSVTAAEMTETLVQINDRLAWVARAKRSATVTLFCECGDCLAEDVPLSLDEHEEIRAREDLIFARGHDAQRDSRSTGGGMARDFMAESLFRFVERAEKLVL